MAYVYSLEHVISTSAVGVKVGDLGVIGQNACCECISVHLVVAVVEQVYVSGSRESVSSGQIGAGEHQAVAISGNNRKNISDIFLDQ